MANKDIQQRNMTQLFTTIVGSQAHGLATPDSDFDYRGVFIVPTRDILSLNSSLKNTNWTEGVIDDTSWELGHFLHLATKCNPTILETFLAPIHDISPAHIEQVEELRALFPKIWNSKYVRDAFIGYGHNQRKKMLEDKDGRKHKYAAAYLRVLWQAKELLETGSFTVKIADTPVGEYIRKVKNGDSSISIGDIINKCNELELAVNAAYDQNPNKETDFDAVNAYLIRMRMNNF